MDKFREEIKNELLELSEKGRVVFGVLICERLYVNYKAFEEQVNWGNHSVLQEGIAMIRQYLINENLFTEEEVRTMLERVDSITPHTEDFPGIMVSFALDASNSVYCTLQYIIEKNIESITDVAIFARDTVDMFIQVVEDIDSNDPGIETKIAINPFMIREKQLQKKTLERISKLQLDQVTDKMVESLSDRSVQIDLNLLPKTIID